MTYTQAEWEPASQEAAKIPEDKLRGRLIETLCQVSELRKQIEIYQELDTPELPFCPPHESLLRLGQLEPFPNCVACIRVHRDELLREVEANNARIAELREKLALTENHVIFVDGKFGEMKTERDRLRTALEDLREYGHYVELIDEALAVKEGK